MDKPLDRTAVGALIGVSAQAVRVYQRRYADTHPFPAPDGTIGRSPYWLPDREQEIRDWDKSRPGQGSGGGRPRKEG